MTWLIGVDCRDGERRAFFSENYAVQMDLEPYLEKVENSIAHAMQHGHELGSGASPVPDFVRQFLGDEIAEDMRSQAGVSVGNHLEMLHRCRKAELVLIDPDDGSCIPLRDVSLAESFEDVFKKAWSS